MDSFRASKARFLLTMLGMVIGSASIILVVTVGMTGKRLRHRDDLQPRPEQDRNAIHRRQHHRPRQYQHARLHDPRRHDGGCQHDPGHRCLLAHAGGPRSQVSMGGGVTKDTMLLGVSPQYKEVRGLVVLAGRFFDDQDAAAHAKVVVLNKPLAIELFGSSAGRSRPEYLRQGHSAQHYRRLPGEYRHLRHLRNQRRNHADSLRGCPLLYRHRQCEGDLLQDGDLRPWSSPQPSRLPT